MSAAESTTDHEVIKKWIEERDGRPSVVAATHGEEGSGGLLRIDFAEKDEAFDEIDWDEFFKTFEESKLAFLHQDKTADGKVSRFNKFVAREG